MADRLRVTELDFDTIKTNLRAFLKQQNQFTDYDFEGSGLSVLLDILAYNTHYNAYYLNMVANESFLDSALLRDSVVSHAKTLGYTPYSAKAPVAFIDFLVQSSTNTPSTLVLPKGYSFLSNQIDGRSYSFVVLEDTVATKANSSFYFEKLPIYEGEFVTYNFVFDEQSNPKQIFTIEESNIDTSTIFVSVRENLSNTSTTVYNKATDILDTTSSSEVYFLQESRSGKYQIYFGNDVIGKKLSDGSIVSVTYLVTNGSTANKANNFVASSTLVDSLSESLTNFIITPISEAAGGAPRESVDEIKVNAPSQFTAQNRLVSYKDYESYIKKNYPAIDSISVWGGEDNSPPVYGKVFVSLKPKDNYFISETEKQRIINEIINPKAVVSVDTQILDPDYLYLLIESFVRYDKRKTTLSTEALKASIRNAILNYDENNLNRFGATFVLSKLQDNIDSVNLSAIIGSETTLKLQKRFNPDLQNQRTYTIDFGAKLKRGTTINRMSSTEFDIFDAFGARRTATIEEIPESFTGISEIQVLNPGTGYTEAPTVTITGDGFGATAEAIIVNRAIQSIRVTNRGINYSRALVTISGGNGFGASAVVVLDNRFGTLRTIYYDELSRRQIINNSAGTINYDTGVVTLNNLRVLSTNASDGLIRLTVESEEEILFSSKNVLITIDESDTSAIVTELIEV